MVPATCGARSSATPASTREARSVSPSSRWTRRSRSRSSCRSAPIYRSEPTELTMADDPTSAMFAGMVDTVKRLASGELTATEPRHAATVILLRDRGDGPEVYLLRRTASMAFAAGFFVFPGGSVDVRDEAFADDAWVGPQPREWADALTCDEPRARSLVCAAVRETFEESGVLLAGVSPDSVVADTSGDDWEADRLALIDRSLSLAEMLQRRGLLLRA